MNKRGRDEEEEGGDIVFDADLASTIKAVQGASTAIELEDALNGIKAGIGTHESRLSLRQAIEASVENSSVKEGMNAKVRRRVTRALKALETEVELAPVFPSKSAAPAPNTVKPSQQTNKPAIIQKQQLPAQSKPSEEEEKQPEVIFDKDLASTIAAVRAATTATELEDALNGVRPGIGGCHSRRTLKRAIETTAKKPEVDAGMNAKVRRRLTRALKALAPGASEGLESNDSSSGKKAAADDSEEQARKKAKPAKAIVPYVVFVGQLEYETTADELKEFLLSKGIEGNIKVRMLTHNDTGKSKGMAFVEVDYAAEMYKCVALHHCMFKGRMINIEKSCGGKNKDHRKEKIIEKRQEQSTKLHDGVNRILDDYSNKGIIQPEKFGSEFKDKVFAYGPHLVSKVSKLVI
jgi:hypothetical protein